MSNLDIYCVTNKKIDFLEKTNLKLAGVGNEEFSKKYLRCDNKNNIFKKEKFYSELTFHYWFWKNILPYEKSEWVGFCQKRRFWIKEDSTTNEITTNNLNDFLIEKIPDELKNFDSFICKPIKISGAKKIKIIKKGWKNLIKNPSLIIKPESIAFHFDMHHGYKNLEKAIELLDNENKKDFLEYVNKNDKFNPHIMCIARPQILNKWFHNLFIWLEKCEFEFGFDNLKGYETQRLYAYLAERYLSFWFKKHTKFKELPWAIIKI